ncbi:MAG: hypothetical protein PHG23_03130 [Candidatus Pacebacteria bacterium]|nr:hypothetical protein [Candidatus Paceibacterota bacterium]
MAALIIAGFSEGYTYGTSEALALFFLGFLLGLSIIIGLVPYLGVSAQILILYLLWPLMSQFLEIEFAGIVMVMFSIAILFGAIETLFSTRYFRMPRK